eukprot:CAMPEP_0194497328 /NCGR_PEP_ID=MMETSP0253-20130528/14303_1 /TAXON_ID=2966 /ORGANISM="Noctiluca scintillans" /LENGTH=188 /DNA_ID=CAMNT_0039338821 /DNA_START=96 /DNA_END=660 /DNA_ORIENTATION=+
MAQHQLRAATRAFAASDGEHTSCCWASARCMSRMALRANEVTLEAPTDLRRAGANVRGAIKIAAIVHNCPSRDSGRHHLSTFEHCAWTTTAQWNVAGLSHAKRLRQLSTATVATALHDNPHCTTTPESVHLQSIEVCWCKNESKDCHMFWEHWPKGTDGIRGQKFPAASQTTTGKLQLVDMLKALVVT